MLRPRFSHWFVLLLVALCSTMSARRSQADIIAAHFFESRVATYDEQTGEPLASISLPPGTAGLAGPSGLTIGPNGNLYVASQFSSEILFFDGTSGLPLPSPLDGGRDGLFATLQAGATPGMLRFGPTGNLYVADTNAGNITIVDGSTGGLLGFAVEGDALAAPGFTIGLAFAANGDLIVGKSSPAFEGSLYRVDGDGVATEIVAPGGAGLMSVNSILFAADGSMLVTDMFGNQIVRFDDSNASNPQPFAVIPPEIEFPLPTGANFPSNFPSDMAWDTAGHLIVSLLGLTNPAQGGENRGALLKYSADGTLLETIVDGLSPIGAMVLSPEVFSGGDLDFDRDVDSEDIGLFLANWTGADYDGPPKTFGEGDLDDDGNIDSNDLGIMLGNWTGARADGRLAAEVIPEPSGLGLALLGLLSCTMLRRRESRGR